MFHRREKVRMVKELIIVGCLLLAQEIRGFRSDSDDISFPLNDENRNYRFSKYENENDKTDEKKQNSEEISNYDFYKPLNSKTEERKFSIEDDHVLSEEQEGKKEDEYPYLKYKNQRKKWLNSHDDDTEVTHSSFEDDEFTEEPKYGFRPEAHQTTKPKTYEHEDSWHGHKQKHAKDSMYKKHSHDSWKNSNPKATLKQNYDDTDYENGRQKSINEKYLGYKSQDTYHSDNKHLNTKAWNSPNNDPHLKENNKNPEYKTEGLPRYANQHDGITNKEWHVSQNEQRHPNYEHHNKNRGKQEHLINDHYYGKTESLNEEGKGYGSDYLHSPEGWVDGEEKSHSSAEPKHSSFGKENNSGKSNILKSDLFKMDPFSVSKFNHGGHSYGWMYKPNEDMYHKLKTDLNLRIRFLKEHEKKLTELQKKHMESFKKFMGNAFQGKKHEYPKYRMPLVDGIYNKPVYPAGPKSHYNSESPNYDSLPHSSQPETHQYSAR
ncbi:uncharacterized protein NPIL_660511 [Nephila pilipes]|uniref:Uncharacterized protein n=1 Tax=Nephila pilipes TaxID=299642 RepID=A0A8X6PGN6_NEPPI|nr:uncharacterized protein NPIL_660511 [Nephila pilipes]